MQRLMRWWLRLRTDERGVETIEWLALAGVIVLLLGAVGAYMSTTGGGQIGATIASTIQGWIKNLP